MADSLYLKHIETAKDIPGNVIIYAIENKLEEADVIYFSDGINELFGISKRELREQVESHTFIKKFFEDAGVKNSSMFQHTFFANEEPHTYHMKKGNKYVWIKAISKTIDYIDGKDIVLTILFDVSRETSGYENLLDSKEEMFVVYSNNHKKVLYYSEKMLEYSDLKYELDNVDVNKIFGFSSYEEFEKKLLNKSKYIRNNDEYFQIETEDIDWRDISSTVLMLRNVTDVVNETKKMEETYRRQINSFMYTSKKTKFIGAVDLNDDVIMNYASEFFDETPNTSSEFIQSINSSIVSSKYNVNFVNSFNINNLIDEFNNGNTSLVYPVIKRKNQKWKFVNIIAKLLKNPINEHIEVYVLEENVTNETMESYINKVIIDDKCQSIGMISVNLKRIYLHKYTADISFVGDRNDFDYDEGMQIIANNLIEDSKKETFLFNVKIENLVRRLTVIGDKFSFVTRVKRKSILNAPLTYIKVSYYNVDKENGLILFVVEDLSKEIELDPITNHLNRAGFIKQCNALLRQDNFDRTKYALLYFNVSGFKAINKNFGHMQGDDILRDIFIELSNSRLEPIIISRIEADNYALICNRNNVNLDYITELTNLSEYKEFGDIRLKCGIYYLENDKSMSISTMYDRAKLAADDYAFNNVRNVVIYNEKMTNDYINKNDVLVEFNDALLNNEFVLYYQPVVDSVTHEITSAEALIRWKKKDGSIVPPMNFIPIIEESGDISKLDSFVISHTFEFISKRLKAGKKVVPISINMSRKDFNNPEVLELYTKHISNDFPNELVRIEITESDYAEIKSRGKLFLSKLRENGSFILLDDFGAGVSSFSTLRDYEFDYLKLDMGFVRKIGDSIKNDNIITSVLEMARRLGLKVIAEGVETEAQASFLKNNNCDFFQGYYFYKPIPEEEFENLIN